MARESGQQQRQDVLMAALARGESRTAAGFCLPTFQRRLDAPQFREAVPQVRIGLVSEALGRVAGLMDSASDARRDLLASAEEAVKLLAVKATSSPRMGEQVIRYSQPRVIEALEHDAAGMVPLKTGADSPVALVTYVTFSAESPSPDSGFRRFETTTAVMLALLA
jgi:hypothetical protein